MRRNSNKIRHTRASHLRAWSNNLWGQESSSPALSPRPTMSMSRGRYSESGTPGELNGSIESMPLPVIDSRQGSDHELKSDPGMAKSKIPRPSMKLSPPAAQLPSHVTTEDTTMVDTLQDECHVRIIEKKRLWPIEKQNQIPKSLQSDFLRSLEPLDAQEIGAGSFMPLVLDEDNKWLVKNDELTLKLTTHSMQDLKDRCQAALDSGFMLLFDHLERIQLANDEFEACQEKERLLVDLKALLKRKVDSIVGNIDLVYGSTVGPQDAQIDKLRKQMEVRILEINKKHNEQMSRLGADLELKLKAEQESHHQEVLELQKMLCDSEAYRVDMSGQLMKKDNNIKSILAESNKQMSLNSNLDHLLEESSAELVRTRKELEESRELIAFLESEAMEEREHTLKLQNRLNIMEDKDRIIADLMVKVQTLEDIHHERENDQLQSSICNFSVKQVLSDVDHVKAELYKSQQLVSEMKAQANRDHRTICRCNEEINTCRLMETENQRTSQKLYLESADKDMQINQMRHKLDSKEEQLSHAYGKLAVLEQELRRLEEFKKVSSEETARIVQERDKYQEAKNAGEQQVKGLTQQIQEFVDFLLHKGKVPALIEGVVHVCRICGCIHQQNLDPQKRILIKGPLEAIHGAYFEPLHNKLAQHHQDTVSLAIPGNHCVKIPSAQHYQHQQ